MAWSLEEIEAVEDLQLLSGHIYMIMGKIQKAQVLITSFFKFQKRKWREYDVCSFFYIKDCYLKSSQPEIAIEMHTDVMEWEQALLLAEKLSPQKIGLIGREYAQQLEQT